MDAALTLGILAGGAGRRVGGIDKGWIEVDGTPQIVTLLAAFAGEVDHVVISANRSLERYRGLGVEVVSDRWPDYPGPLAGLAELATAMRGGCLLTLPVDVERWPADLVPRLRAAAGPQRAALAHDEHGLQPLIACYPAVLAVDAARAFDTGERSVRRWQAGLPSIGVVFDGFNFGNRNQLAR